MYSSINYATIISIFYGFYVIFYIPHNVLSFTIINYTNLRASNSHRRYLHPRSLCTTFNNKSQSSSEEKSKSKSILDEFKTAKGEIVNPYRVLKVSRKATREEIKFAYKSLCKKYHPDAVRFKTVLPGNCNNLDDVRDEWERIQLSYNILSEKKTRARYNNKYNLSDPGAALGRAALSTVGWGVLGLGKGIFKLGEMAMKKADNVKKEETSTTNNSL